MRLIDCQQGTPQWTAAKLGVPSASNFDRIITRSGRRSGSATRYMADLLVEHLLRAPVDHAATRFMERGTELEPEALEWYAFTRAEVRRVGFCLRDDLEVGCSPDGLVGEDGGVEIKCKSASVHMLALLGGITDDHYVQIQGNLWVTGRQWWDRVFFHPTLPRHVYRVERDAEFIDALAREVSVFAARLEEKKREFAEYRVAERAPAPVDDDPFATRDGPGLEFTPPTVTA